MDEATEAAIRKLAESSGIPVDLAKAIVLRQKGLISAKAFEAVLGYR